MQQLYPFQSKAVSQMLAFLRSPTSGVYNAAEMGVGKTIMAIECMNQLGCLSALIICPAVMRHTWAKELATWEKMPSIDTCIVETSFDTNRIPLSDRVIISYDLAARHAAKLASKTWEFLILDEAHYLKNRKAKRTKEIMTHVWPKARYRMALSGTPFTQSIIDGYTLFSALAPDKFTNFYAFADRYAFRRETPWGIKYVGIKNAEELSQIIRKRFYIRMKKEEVLKELPPKTFSRITLPAAYSLKPPADEEAAVKRELEALKLKLNRDETLAVLPASIAAQRRLQGEKKLPAVVEFITDLLEQDIPVVAFAYHRNFIHELSRHLSAFKPVVITGDTSGRERAACVESFQSGGTNLFIGQFTAAGVGITLTRSSTVVCAELDWSPAVIAQAVDRTHRIGQECPVTIYYFVVKDSLEEGIVETVMGKARTFAQVVEN